MAQEPVKIWVGNDDFEANWNRVLLERAGIAVSEVLGMGHRGDGRPAGGDPFTVMVRAEDAERASALLRPRTVRKHRRPSRL